MPSDRQEKSSADLRIISNCLLDSSWLLLFEYAEDWENKHCHVNLHICAYATIAAPQTLLVQDIQLPSVMSVQWTYPARGLREEKRDGTGLLEVMRVEAACASPNCVFPSNVSGMQCSLEEAWPHLSLSTGIFYPSTLEPCEVFKSVGSSRAASK